MAKYLRNAATALVSPPQSEPLDERQVKNSAGGYAYPVDEWKRMERFLILGSEGGSYYATEQKLTKENLKAVQECVNNDGIRAVKLIVDISDKGRAYKNDPAIMALACAAGTGNDETRAFALANLSKVCRIGTHLFHFVDYVQQFRGWGRGLRTAVADWYLSKDADKLADQVTKYQQRDGWSHYDVLRQVHPQGKGQHNAIFRWITGEELGKRTVTRGKGRGAVTTKYKTAGKLPERIIGHALLQSATTAKEAVKLIREYGLVRESVPTELLNESSVWAALLEKMPLTAMIRNLGVMSKVGLLTPMSEASKTIRAKLADTEALKKARVHPIQVLVAQKTYALGRGLRGTNTWTPVSQIVDALDDAYYETFNFIEPTGKRFYLGLDISGSMYSGTVAGIPDFTPAIASGAMAMVTVKTELEYYAAGFTTGGGGYYGGLYGGSVMETISLSPKLRLDSVVKHMQDLSRKMGGTDCALPMLDAMKKNLKVDTFIIYTDSETWAGDVHPTKALQQYRDKTGIPAKLVVMAMVPNQFSIANPNDGGMLDICGFDTNTPLLISDFSK